MNRPDDWNAPYLLGLIHLERRDAEGAMAAFRRRSSSKAVLRFSRLWQKP